jgi:hypothetical protein
MDSKVKQLVRSAILEIIESTVSEGNIRKSFETHQAKIHFVPIKYRVLGGLLQSLNIKFGNFIEKLLALVVDQDENVEALSASGRKIGLSMTARTDMLIDQYITNRQLPNSPDECDEVFQELLDQIVEIEQSSGESKQIIRKDVDALFETSSGEIVYLEIKYNDDHDTGKFVDINRKFIKTYAGLVNYLETSNPSDIKPILYYFNPVKRWGPIYAPSKNIYRGSQLLDEYFETKFADIDQYLQNLGDDEEIVSIFDDLYNRIRYGSDTKRLF